jgi:hypothetical protein
MDRPADFQDRTARRGRLFVVVLGIVAVLVLVGGIVAVGSKYLRPWRLPHGEWVLAIVTPARSWPPDPAIRYRYIWCCTDSLLRQEFDLDGDGRFDCRKDECHKQVEMCVSRRVGNDWIAEPDSVDDCGVEGER